MSTTSPIFSGCAAALVTPFCQDGSIDLSALRILIEKQMEAQMDAIVILGTTGEPSTLTMEERSLIIKTCIKTVRGTMPVIVGTGANDTQRATEYARQAEALGASGQLTVTPYYNKTTQSGLIRHFERIADSCPLPMILYNVPSRTGMAIAADTVAQLSLHPRIVGIKEASGDLSLAAEMIFTAQGRLNMYSGNDDLTLPLMALGACGAISVCANVAPVQTRALTCACLGGCYDHARDMHLALLPLIRALFAQVNPIPVKAALSMMGLAEDVLRLPLTPLEEPHRARLAAHLSSMHII